jgi:S-adenosyl-L-methionine hydrolase (adenosine-forming)
MNQGASKTFLRKSYDNAHVNAQKIGRGLCASQPLVFTPPVAFLRFKLHHRSRIGQCILCLHLSLSSRLSAALLMPPIVTLTTDFGLQDGFVGTMKGVIWSICPDARIADITHAVPPQAIQVGAMALWRAVPFFPPGTIHVAVVDPGVGTGRRSLAARFGAHYFVGPDNGLCTPLVIDANERGEGVEFIHLDNPRYWLPKVSNTFHGRDIFSPVGAHLANGVPLRDLGTPLHDPVWLPPSRAERTSGGWRAHITAVDVFGNLTLDLRFAELHGRSDILCRLHGQEIAGLAVSYGHRPSGELIVLIDSEYFLEIAVVNGNAAERLEAQVGDVVEVILGEGQ